jgi:hypothetical protein
MGYGLPPIKTKTASLTMHENRRFVVHRLAIAQRKLIRHAWMPYEDVSKQGIGNWKTIFLVHFPYVKGVLEFWFFMSFSWYIFGERSVGNKFMVAFISGLFVPQILLPKDCYDIRN